MTPPSHTDLSHLSMLELFRVEAENQAAIITNGLLDLERSGGSPQVFEMLMRAAHSFKGAARIVNAQLAVRLAHAMEDCFVAAQQSRLVLRQPEIDLLFRTLDTLSQIARLTEADLATWESQHQVAVGQLFESLLRLLPGTSQTAKDSPDQLALWPVLVTPPGESFSADSGSLIHTSAEGRGEPNLGAIATRTPEAPERVVRLTAENLNRLLGLAGESLIESRWLGPFADSLDQLRRQQAELGRKLEALERAWAPLGLPDGGAGYLKQVSDDLAVCQQGLSQRLAELNMFERRCSQLSERLYGEMLRTRMRPFSDGVRRFPRMVRDLAHSLGKEIKLEIVGENTQVDRDILERLETPLAHLLRNAVDHGCERPLQRQQAGKPPEGSIRIEARHSAGLLMVTVADDGPGVPLPRVRNAIIEKGLATPAQASRLSESQLLEFLFLPGFSLKETVNEISGRGVGLDVVQNLVKGLRGTVRLATQPGRGVRVQLQVPLTLSVLRALLVEVKGEPYALPLALVVRALMLPRRKIHTFGGKPHFRLGELSVGLLSADQILGGAQLSGRDARLVRPSLCADQVLEKSGAEPSRLSGAGETLGGPSNGQDAPDLPVVVLGDRNARIGLVVDRLCEERELVVQPLDVRLGKVPHILAAALRQDGSPVLIIDVEDLLKTPEDLIPNGPPKASNPVDSQRTKRVLAVDDSLTMRELVRKLLTSRGYPVDVAVDGLDGWNAVRASNYDLVITDIEMPRMDGLELTALIKQDPSLKSVRVMIVSYRDGHEERLRGLNAGVDYYLTKGNFDEETLWRAVVELLGEPGR